MTATMTPNGPPRKQLSDQINRLEELLAKQDALIDGFAAALDEAVGEATKAGVKEALEGVLVRLLADGEVRAAVHTATAPSADVRLSAWARLKEKVRRAAARLRAGLVAAAAAVAARAARARAAIGRALARLPELKPVRTAAGIVVAVAAAAAAGRLSAGRRLAACVVAAQARAATAWSRVRAWLGTGLLACQPV
jgi:hypothetical protein